MMINLLIYLILLTKQTRSDYIISNELTLFDDSEPGYELINLNKLKNNNLNNQFKLVNDTSLVNYVELSRDATENTLVILKKKIHFDVLCDTSETTNCVQNLKIVAVNENDFIELPIRIQHAQPQQQPKKGIDNLQQAKSKLKLKFNQSSLSLIASLQHNTFTIDAAALFLNDDLNKKQRKRIDQYNLEDLMTKIEYKAYAFDNLPSLNEFNLIISKQNDTKLKLNAFFLSQYSLQNALNNKKKFTYIIEAYIPADSQSVDTRAKFGPIKNASLSLEIKIEEQDDLDNEMFKPLDFENPIYITKLTDNLKANTIVLQPKIKEAINNSQIVCSLTTTKKANDTKEDDSELPFYINENNCSIMLKQNTFDLITELTKEEVYTFGIKATYKNLNNTGKLLNYYYDYMIPAFSKIEIRIKHEPAKAPVVKYETILTRHESVSNSMKTQTIILNINEPIESDSKLIKFMITDDDLSTERKNQFEWMFNKSDEIFKFNKMNKNLIASNRIVLTDRFVYKTTIQLRERLKQSVGPVLKEIKLEFRVDYDPLIFENEEYSLLVTQTNILNENLIRVATVQTKHQQNKTNIKYRILMNNSDETSDSNQFFQIDSNSGWLSAHRQLSDQLSYFELNIIATNVEQQKSATVKLKITVECQMHKKDTDKQVKFTVYENLPNQTQIATLKSICSNLNLKYEISNTFTSKLCSKALLTNQIYPNQDDVSCNYYTLNNASNLVSLDSLNGHILTNNFMNTSLFMSSLQNDDNLINDEDFKLKLSFKITASNPFGLSITFEIDLTVQSAPKILNFFDNLEIAEPNQSLNYTSEEVLTTSSCLYNYKYLIEKDLETKSDLIRFVKIDFNSAHLQAEFKQQITDCKTSTFVINSNGCLSLKYDDQNKNCINESLTNDYTVLKSGSYNIEFKLCYYDSNKVSCSPFYSQHIYVEKDLLKSSKFVTNILVNDFFDNIDNKSFPSTGQFLLKSIITNFYVLITLIIISAVTIIVILVISIKLCKYYKNRKAFKSEMAYVLPIKKSMDSKNSETSSDSGSSHININQTETISNAATTSSKLSKTDDENDEIVKIRVSDDFYTMDQNNKNAAYVYATNNNLGYAGSFSSISSSTGGSSCLSNDLKQFTQIKAMTPINSKSSRSYEANIKQQGIYSVKNASIQYNLTNHSNIIDETDSHLNTDQKVIQLIENIYGVNTLNSTFNNPNSVFYNSLNLKVSETNSAQQSQQLNQPKNQQQLLNFSNNQIVKTSSSFTSSPNTSPNDKRNLIKCNNNKSLIYDYLKSKEVLLKPNEIIASVV